MGNQITTLTFFRYTSLGNKIWAFMMMQFMHKKIYNLEGQTFYKLMGSGKEGFNPLPDWNVYSLLQVWENEDAATNFFENSNIIKKYKSHTEEVWTVYLKNITAKGSWSRRQPFEKYLGLDANNRRVAVITRATIRVSKLIKFWRYVPVSQQHLKNNSGLIFTKGVGEIPVVQMATFSIWKDTEALKSFAYQHAGHKNAIKKTKELQWYKEELFSRFQPYKSKGTWFGKEVLSNL